MSYYTDHGEILYQIRLNVNKQFTVNEELNSLLEVHDASLICQYDAFVNFINECESKDETDNPLYKWTKETIENENKKIKYKNIYSVLINKQQVYKEEIADSIINKIEELNIISVESIDKFDTQPKNNPQPPKKFRNKT
jgi:hypothetical protein|tara:strand:+ start:808 stop:1224 length:417 start_codon:yes stop_codon:yes gene_type:complete